MFGYLQDKWQTTQLKARYQRLLHERLIFLADASGPQPVSEDPGNWTLVGNGSVGPDSAARSDARTKARHLVLNDPHARNLMRLFEVYVTGPGLKLIHKPRDPQTAPEVGELISTADRLWSEFLLVNERHYSFPEHARRTWRDGECFVRKFSQTHWPPLVRFVDPETIGPTKAEPDSQGILTDKKDVETPRWYLRIDPLSGDFVEPVDANDILHTKIGADSNQKRGTTLFAPVIDHFDRFEKWMETELAARKLQASIVLWRKVTNPASATPFGNESSVESLTGGHAHQGGSRFQPGSMLTTGTSTDLQFVQPDTNYADTVPLGRMLLLSIAAGAGLPEFMLTSDASNANYASTMVAEGPAVKMFQSEQCFFGHEFTRLWRWVMSDAVKTGDLPPDFFSLVIAKWCFAELVNRDRPRERMADVRLIEAEVLSRAEVARRDGADPEVMRQELRHESEAEDRSNHDDPEGAQR